MKTGACALFVFPLYPHDFGGWVEQKYLAKPLKFVEYKNSGYEAKMGEWMEKVWREK